MVAIKVRLCKMKCMYEKDLKVTFIIVFLTYIEDDSKNDISEEEVSKQVR